MAGFGVVMGGSLARRVQRPFWGVPTNWCWKENGLLYDRRIEVDEVVDGIRLSMIAR